MKSHKMVSKERGWAAKPEWAATAKTAMRISTSDSQFDLVHYAPGEGGGMRVCWQDGRKRWHEADVDRRRITEIVA